MHKIDLQFNEQYLETAPDILRAVLTFSTSDYGKLESLKYNARNWACRLAVADPTSPNLLLGLKIAARATGGMMVGAMRPGEQVTWWLGEGEPTSWLGPGPNNLADVGNWHRAYHFASICRDVDVMKWLVEMPVSLVRAAPGVYSDEFDFFYMEALQAFQRGERKTAPLFIKALEATAPERLEVADVDDVLDLVVPEMEVFHHILTGDARGLNEALEKAVALHEKHWDTDEDNRRRSAEGFMAIGLLAMACIAHDRGMPITVQSDYLPAWLIRGEWAERQPG